MLLDFSNTSQLSRPIADSVRESKILIDSSWSYEQGVYAAPDASLAVKYGGS